MKGTLYKLLFPNGKAYIGITTRSPRERWWDHCQYAHDGSRKWAVYNAWRKHGEPVMQILAEFSSAEELKAAEQAAITAHGTLVPSGYNMTLGGETNPMEIPELARRAGDKNIGRKHTAAARRNMGLSRLGRKASEDHRAKISKGQLGRVHSQETREKIAAKARGRFVGDSTRALLSYRRKGVPKGPMAEETKAKLSAARRSYWERMRRENPEQLQTIIAKSAEGIQRAWDRRRSA